MTISEPSAEANPAAGEIVLRSPDGRRLILKLDWRAVSTIAKAWASDVEALAKDERYMARLLEARKRAGNPSPDPDWSCVLARAIERYDLEKLAFYLACAAQHHQPGTSAKDVIEMSPGFVLAAGAAQDIQPLFFWGDTHPPQEVLKPEAVPFVMRLLSDTLSRLRPRTA